MNLEIAKAVSKTAHVLPSNEVLNKLMTSNEGLDAAQVEERLSTFGPNTIRKQASASVLERLWAQINSTLIYILGVGAIISFVFHHNLDGYVIIAVVVLNVTLGFFMESKAANATNALEKMMSSHAQVIRSGQKQFVESNTLTVGDIIQVQPGDVVPADGRLLLCYGLQVLESALTGESQPMNKDVTAVQEEEVSLADRKCMVYSGTQVLSGTATMVVTAIGPECEIGRISEMLASVKPVKTALVLELERFGRILSVIIAIAAGLTCMAASLRGELIADSLAIAIGTAVAAIPEGLPSCITVVFAVGVRFMAKRHALVKSLPAVETLGSVSVICSDKTGTLTMNKMVVQSVVTAKHSFKISVDGTISSETGESACVSDDSKRVMLAHVLPGLLCNNANIVTVENESTASVVEDASSGVHLLPSADVDLEANHADTAANNANSNATELRVEGNPTEASILNFGAYLVQSMSLIGVRELRDQFTTVGAIPFSSKTKFMASVHWLDVEWCSLLLQTADVSFPLIEHVNAEGKVKVLMLKGAPDVLMPVCFSSVADSSVKTKYWAAAIEDRASKGMRTLALAFTLVPADYTVDQNQPLSEIPKLTGSFHLLSVLGIMDPPRPEAIVAVTQARAAGIVVKMITGDHPATALSIAKMMGIVKESGESEWECRVVTGRDLDALMQLQPQEAAENALDSTVKDVNVFARVTPEHKLLIVQSLRRQRIVCSMTGDGVNDAPALKAADIGVAMGIAGTDVAKNAANMIITDDNFASIVDAICIGRCTYENLVKIITFILSVNGGQAFSIILAIAIGIEVPITALQILWVNMLVSVALGIELAFDAPAEDILDRPPRPVDTPLFGELVAWRIATATVSFVAVVLGVYCWELQRTDDVTYLRTCAVNALVMAQMVYILNCRSLNKNLPWREFFFGNRLVYVGAAVVVVCQMLFTYTSPFQFVLGSTGLDGESWGKIVLLALSVMVGVELDKYLSNRVKILRSIPTVVQERAEEKNEYEIP